MNKSVKFASLLLAVCIASSGFAMETNKPQPSSFFSFIVSATKKCMNYGRKTEKQNSIDPKTDKSFFAALSSITFSNVLSWFGSKQKAENTHATINLPHEQAKYDYLKKVSYGYKISKKILEVTFENSSNELDSARQKQLDFVTRADAKMDTSVKSLKKLLKAEYTKEKTELEKERSEYYQQAILNNVSTETSMPEIENKIATVQTKISEKDKALEHLKKKVQVGYDE